MERNLHQKMSPTEVRRNDMLIFQDARERFDEDEVRYPIRGRQNSKESLLNPTLRCQRKITGRIKRLMEGRNIGVWPRARDTELLM